MQQKFKKDSPANITIPSKKSLNLVMSNTYFQQTSHRPTFGICNVPTDPL